MTLDGFERLVRRLVDEPVEPQGILSRIETHIVALAQQQLDMMAMLDALDRRLYALESRDRSLTHLVALQRRVTALEAYVQPLRDHGTPDGHGMEGADGVAVSSRVPDDAD